MPLCTSIDMSMGLAYVGLTEMTMTVGISMAGKSLQETRQGVSNLSQKYPCFGHFLYFEFLHKVEITFRLCMWSLHGMPSNVPLVARRRCVYHFLAQRMMI